MSQGDPGWGWERTPSSETGFMGLVIREVTTVVTMPLPAQPTLSTTADQGKHTSP